MVRSFTKLCAGKRPQHSLAALTPVLQYGCWTSTVGPEIGPPGIGAFRWKSAPDRAVHNIDVISNSTCIVVCSVCMYRTVVPAKHFPRITRCNMSIGQVSDIQDLLVVVVVFSKIRKRPPGWRWVDNFQQTECRFPRTRFLLRIGRHKGGLDMSKRHKHPPRILLHLHSLTTHSVIHYW